VSRGQGPFGRGEGKVKKREELPGIVNCQFKDTTYKHLKELMKAKEETS